MNAIETSQLTRRFGRTSALVDLNLAVPTGSVCVLLGPNGAGKSTAIRLLLNLLRPTSGNARVLGIDSTKLTARDFQRIGYVTEEQNLPDWMTVRQLINFCRPLYPTWDDALAARLLTLFTLPENRALKKMSRGMRMKAALLSTLAYRPELLLLDEPFSGLDPLTRDEFVQGLLELPNEDRPTTTLISTHDIDDVERLADQVAFLSESKLLLCEPADALRARFRAVEIIGAGEVGAFSPQSTWLGVRQPSDRVLQFTHSSFSHETEPELRSIFPGANVQVRALTLREIFLALAKNEKPTRNEEAAA
ncbi:ABC transporter ATP-binding protein [Oleiharenicola lentus]|uniref:ABC transporter ATP-binding protein n=1 Tax=Oleiharenicola lentus TaxID=2508720 RepID=UPI003F6784E7